MKNNIGLLRLTQKIIFNEYIRPACLPVNNKIPEIIQTVGFGLHKKRYRPIQKGYLTVIDDCSVYGSNFGSSFCAEIRYDNYYTCFGDPGSPVQIQHPSLYCMYTIIGVTSASAKCAETNIPGIFVNVEPYIDWIESIVWL